MFETKKRMNKRNKKIDEDFSEETINENDEEQ